MRRIALLSLLLTLPTLGQVFNCSSGFNNTSGNACGAPTSYGYPGGYAFEGNAGPLASGAMTLVPVGQGHNGNALWYQTAVNVQAFTETFTFVPNGYNLAMVIQNYAMGYCNPFQCGAGAGAEGGFSQFASNPNIPTNNVWALEFDSYSSVGQGAFSYSTVQQYQTLQSPAMPNAGCNTACNGGSPWNNGVPQYATTKISTSPVPLNSPASTQATTTGDTYSATVIYDGSNLTVNLFDVTADGTCTPTSSPTCFTNSWSNVLIPEIVQGNSAVIGFTAGVGVTASNPILISGWKYTVNTPTGSPSYTAWNAGSTYNNGATSNASPVYSVAAGSYASTQSVTISSATSGSYVCYVLSSATLAFYPQTDNNGGCTEGTLYTGAVSIASTATLYAMASSSASSPTTSYGPPSTLVAGTYTITGGGAASTPTFSPVAGTYVGTQSVAISTASAGAVICYNTTGSPATNGSTGCTTGTLYSGPVSVSSSETLYAVAGGTGHSDSTVGSAGYVVTSAKPAVIGGKIVFSGKAVVQ
jgi:hypothetical protein